MLKLSAEKIRSVAKDKGIDLVKTLQHTAKEKEINLEETLQRIDKEKRIDLEETLQRVPQDKRNDLQELITECLFSAYKQMFIELGKDLEGDLEFFPAESLKETKEVLNEILDNFFYLIRRSIDREIHQEIMRIMPMLNDAVAQVSKASKIYNDTKGDKKLYFDMLDLYFNALLACRKQIVEINKQLEGSKEFNKHLKGQSNRI